LRKCNQNHYQLKLHAFSGQAPPGPGNLLNAASGEKTERGKEEERGREEEESKNLLLQTKGRETPLPNVTTVRCAINNITYSHSAISGLQECTLSTCTYALARHDVNFI